MTVETLREIKWNYTTLHAVYPFGDCILSMI